MHLNQEGAELKAHQLATRKEQLGVLESMHKRQGKDLVDTLTLRSSHIKKQVQEAKDKVDNIVK